MRILSWNIRGLNNPLKQLEVRKMARQLKPNNFGIVENKVRFIMADSIFDKCLRNWNYIHNGSVEHAWRIWFCW